MINTKLKPVVVLTLIFSLLLSGCWDRTEVDNLAIVTGIGIDQIPGKETILLTIQVVNPSAMKPGTQGSGQQSPFIVRTIQGKSFFEAIGNFTRDLPRTVFFDHNEIVVLGQEFAKSGIADVFDYMERNKEFRPTNLILVADKTAKEIVEAKMGLEELSAKGVRELLNKNLFTYPINHHEFLLGLNNIGVSFSPVIQLAEPDKEIQELAEAAGGQADNTGQGNNINIERIAIFKNFRLIGFLTVEESKGLLWLNNKMKEDTVIIPYQENDRAGEVTINLFEGNTKITPNITEKGITMEISCSGKARLREAGNTGIAVEKSEIFEQLTKAAERILQERVEKAINTAQKQFNADFVGFANHIHNLDPVVWKSLEKDWDKYFPNINYKVSFKVEIINMGRYRGSINEAFRKE